MLPWAHPTYVQIPNGVSIGSAVFAQFTAESHYTLQQAAPRYPIKIAPSYGASEPPCNTWFLRPIKILNANGSSVGLAVFAGLTSASVQRRYNKLQGKNIMACPIP